MIETLPIIFHNKLILKEREVSLWLKKIIKELVDEALRQLEQEGYTEKGIKKHFQTYSCLISYADGIGEKVYSEAIGLAFLKERYGTSFNAPYGNNSDYANEKIRHLKALWHLQEYGTIHFANRSGKKKPFQCPERFAKEYGIFLAYCDHKNYTGQGRRSIIYPVRNLLTFLDVNDVPAMNDVSADHILKFLSMYIDCSQVYIRSLTAKLRVFFRCLYENRTLTRKLWHLLPNIKYVRDAYIPSSWDKKDVLKLLESIDRGNPCGKRDYAILLLVARLGLRVSDIRNLKLADFDWAKRKIHIVQIKTREPLELPLLDDVGWAIIDYLKNGRPKTDSDTVFVKHSPNGGPFSDRNTLHTILHKNMRYAGLEIPKTEHRGLHSLRSTLARTMLESGASLPTISEVLGHRSTLSTSHYLKINMEALRKCPIDPEEVFFSE